MVDVGLPKGNSTYAVLDANVLLPPRLEVALTKSLKDLKNPPYTQAELLEALALHGANNTVKHFKMYWNL